MAAYLKHRPGDYETVRRFLGHRSIQTTTSFYIGLQTTQATVEFGKVIQQALQGNKANPGQANPLGGLTGLFKKKKPK